ncbi:DUF2442 domain-containing protein [Mucilaginibacter ginsenosidivorans]|uniref:DUF2442 domain-containing protein n=1 Tax=Mucilaginibacter ginsenosidivorans TaxID=398053 RepID=A0A5B8UXB0_9SPHI|nr:DUF2442 domain-containing protein [Mucilaginibacter ginsenosidivorans]QEC63026.1 DUF2442 domain-containing protein [Mucilaginibacter ginsenosidivorans]
MRITQVFDKSTVIDPIEIKSAHYTGEYSIDLSFSDGTKRLVDFKPFLKGSLHPSISKYLDKELFLEFKIVAGNLNWNDYDLIFPVEDLYKGQIQ